MFNTPNKLSSLSLEGQSRRAFFKQATAITAGTLAGMILPSSVLAEIIPKSPQRGGHLILGIDNASSSDRIDPAFYFEQYMYHIGRQLFNTLTELDDDGSLKAGLASEWSAHDQGAQWVFTLREDVTFHNGKVLQAEDVVYSLNHHRSEDSQSAVRGYMNQVIDIEAVNKQVVITLSSPNVDFPFLLAEVNFAITPEGEDFDQGIGTGPYELEYFEPGVRTLTRRNNNYWKPDSAYVDSVETLAFNDSTSRVAALLSGAVHFINRVPSGIVSRLEAARGIQAHRNPSSFQVTFPGLADREPFSNPDVRLALKYALDREQLLTSLVNGYGEVANDNPIFPTNRYFTRDLPVHSYDPDKALFHWKKAGFEQDIVLSAADGASFDGAVSAAEVYRQSAVNAGIPFRVNRVPADGYWSEVWRNHPFCASGWSSRPTADAYLSMVNLSDAPWNEARWQSPQLDQLIVAARSELNEDRRRQIYHDIQVLFNEEGSTVVPLYIDSVSGTAENVQGYFNVPGEVATRVVERLWLET